MNLHLTPAGAAFIARFEAFRPGPYKDEAGHWTVGYGHRITSAELGIRVTESEARRLLIEDAERESAAVQRALDVLIKPHQADALISLAFNCGGRAIAKSTLMNYLNAGHIEAAADQFLEWNKVTRGGKHRVSKGLTARRIAERKVFLFSDYGSAPESRD